MKRNLYRGQIDALVATYGISQFCKWQTRPVALRVVFGDAIWLIKAGTTMTRQQFAFELGKLDTLARCMTGQWPEQPAEKVRKRRVPRSNDPRQVDVEDYPGVCA